MSPIAVIPARGTSQRLPQKNLRRLGGKPLTQWAVDAARMSGLFKDRIYVTTDDDAVAKLARSLGVTVLMRHKETARADATLDHVVTEVRDQLHTRAPIYLLTPTSPFRNPETMRKAWTSYAMNDDVGKIVSVVLYHDPPHWALRLADGCAGRVTPVFPEMFSRTRTELPKCVQQDGSHVIQGANGGYTMAFEVPMEESVDINTLEDLEWAEFLLAKGRVKWIATS
jgi:CMP-N-acetylneuraminic acid synthetase